VSLLHEHPALFPDGAMSDQPETVYVAEVARLREMRVEAQVALT